MRLACSLTALRNALVLVVIICVQVARAQNIEQTSASHLLTKLNASTTDTTRLRLLLEIGKFHVFKPGELKSDLDSAESYIGKARKLSDSLHLIKWEHESQTMAMVIVMERGDAIKGHLLFNQALREYKITQDKEAEAFLRFRYGVWLTTRGTYPREMIQQFYESASLYRQINKPLEEINVLMEIAALHFYDGKLDVSETELLHVLSRYKALGYPRLQTTYSLLSGISRVKGNFNKSLRYAMLAIESMNKSGDTSSAADLYADLGRIYLEIGNNEKGIEWYKKALQKWGKSKRPNFAVFAAGGYVSGDLIKRNRPREALALTLNLSRMIPPITRIQKACIAQNLACCYDALGNYEKAERYYQQSLQLYAASTMDFEFSQEARRSIGKFYLSRNNYSSAGKYLRKALQSNPQKLSAGALKDIHHMLFRVDSAESNYISAIDHYQIYKQLNDSILDTRKTREIEELQIQYETEKRKKDLVLLNNKSKLQQNKLQRANMAQNYTQAVVALLVIILALLYQQYKLKNRSNRDLKKQKQEISEKNNSLKHFLNEKEWLLKEIHHRVKNNLQIVISLLNTQSSYMDNDVAKKAIKESQYRMHSISLIHQKLYQSDNLAYINMADYIKDLALYLKESFDHSGHIHFGFDLAQVFLDVNQAIPVGLILNEAITNAIKYAFVDKDKGSIRISFSRNEEGQVCLTVGDDGPGFPLDFQINDCQSLGMNLMKGLSSQLEGSFDISRKNGITCLTVTFTLRLHSEEDRLARN